jgi:hypothetical protein
VSWRQGEEGELMYVVVSGELEASIGGQTVKTYR